MLQVFLIQMHHNVAFAILLQLLTSLFTPLFISQDSHLKTMVIELNQEKT